MCYFFFCRYCFSVKIYNFPLRVNSKVFLFLHFFFLLSFKTLRSSQCNVLYKYLIIDGKNIFKYLWKVRKCGSLRPCIHVSNCNKLQNEIKEKSKVTLGDWLSINLLKRTSTYYSPLFWRCFWEFHIAKYCTKSHSRSLFYILLAGKCLTTVLQAC